MLKKYLILFKEIRKKVSYKTLLLNNLISFLMGWFFILPFVLLDVNLLYLYYDLEILLVLLLHIFFVCLMIITTKFFLDSIKPYAIDSYENKKSVYIVVLISSIIIASIVFSIYLVLRS